MNKINWKNVSLVIFLVILIITIINLNILSFIIGPAKKEMYDEIKMTNELKTTVNQNIEFKDRYLLKQAANVFEDKNFYYIFDDESNKLAQFDKSYFNETYWQNIMINKYNMNDGEVHIGFNDGIVVILENDEKEVVYDLIKKKYLFTYDRG